MNLSMNFNFMRRKFKWLSYENMMNKEFLRGKNRAALWEIEDEPRLWHMQETISNFSKDPRFLDNEVNILKDFDAKLDRVYNDHKHNLFNEITEPHVLFEPTTVSIRPNVILNKGRVRAVQILAGRNGSLFQYFASGTSNMIPLMGQTGLIAPNSRIDMLVNGWITPAGDILRMGGIFGSSNADAVVKEFGATDLPSDPSTFFNRNRIVESSEYINHVLGNTFYTASHSTSFQSFPEEDE